MGVKHSGKETGVDREWKILKTAVTILCVTAAAALLLLSSGHTADAMDARRYRVIAKGATLAGYTKYRSKAGSNCVRRLSDSPKYLCCSSFVSWCFSRSRVAKIDYSTWDFCHSERFRKIPARRLKPGDVGLIQDRNRLNNHVAIYIGKRGKERLWMHCTGHGGKNGVVVGTDGRLNVFYRYKGFRD